MNNQPPKWPLRFFRWFCNPDFVEDIEGDLLERFDKRITEEKPARWLFTLDIFKLFRPGLIRQLEGTQKLNFSMFYHNFLIGYRTIIRDKSNSLINIGGLTLGMTVAILIGLWIHDEVSFNKNHKNYPYLAKVLRHSYEGQDRTITSATQVTGVGTLLRSEYANYFESVAMVRQRIEYRLLSLGNKKFIQSGYFVQPDLPKMLTLDMMHGDWSGLEDMNSIMLSQSVAQKLFGTENPVGQIIRMDAKWGLTVTGVYKDLPANSEFEAASYFATLDRYIEGWQSLNSWDNYFIKIYVQIQEGSDFHEISEIIHDAMQAHVDENTGASEIFLQPMREWHLYSNYENGEVKTSLRLKYVWTYTMIGVFVLILACINFANLSTARAEKRAKEIGIRKSMGSRRSQLIYQFLSESVLIAITALIVSIGLVWLILPWFNEISSKQLSIPFGNSIFWFALIGFTLITSFLAGSYPAFYLSAMNAIHALKGNALRRVRGAHGLTMLSRKSMVIFQFTISITLISGTIIIYKQIELAKTRSVGYDREQLISLTQRAPEYYAKYEVLKDELLKTGYVEAIGSSNYSVTSTLGWNIGFDWEGKEPDYNPAFNTIRISPGYSQAVGLDFLERKETYQEFEKAGNVLINESALKLMDLKNPVGSRIRFDRGWFNRTDFTIIGVVKDMVKGSPFEHTYPSIMFINKEPMSSLYLRLKPQINLHQAIIDIEQKFSAIVPSAIFDFKFADQEYDLKFQSEERIGQIASYFALVTILISCLGLFGLSSYLIDQRTKEIGIRKALGASATNLWKLLSGHYITLVGISSLLATPISYYLLSGWLDGYAIRIEIGWRVFAVAGLAALVIALATVSYQTLKAAAKNPVESLRDE